MKGKALVLFDGVCGLCDRTIKMLLKGDGSHLLMFAPLQGATAATIFMRHPEIKKGSGSLVFVENYGDPNERVFLQSDGVLGIFDAMGGFWRVISWLRLVPAPVRNAGYAWIARNRYEWFGKYDECQIPSPETRVRFLP